MRQVYSTRLKLQKFCPKAENNRHFPDKKEANRNVDVSVENALGNNYVINDKKLRSTCIPTIKVKTSYDISLSTTPPKLKRAHIRVDWQKFNADIEQNYSNPFCYSSLDELMYHCYNWINKIIGTQNPKSK